MNRPYTNDGTTEYVFGMQIQADGQTFIKKFTITLAPCADSSCSACGGTQATSPSNPQTSGSGNEQQDCQPGYHYDEGNAECIEDGAAEGSVQMAQTMAAVGASISIASSIISMSSMNGAFSIVNQFQLFLLLPMVPPYFPAKLKAFILGVDFAMISFDFLQLNKLPFIKKLKKWISFPQKDGYLNDIGLISGSSFFNYISIMTAFVVFGAIHLVISLMYVHFKDKPKEHKWRKFMKNLFRLMTFNIYIRLIMESFLFMMLSIMTEIKLFNTGSIPTTISLGLSFVFLLSITIFSVLSIWLYWSQIKGAIHEEYWMYKELFDGLKNGKYSHLHSVLFMLWRFLSILILIFCPQGIYLLRASLFAMTQCISMCYLVIIRPFGDPKENINECISQIIYFMLSLSLISLENRGDWTDTYEDIYMHTLIFAPIIGIIVSFVALIRDIIKCKNRYKNKTNPKTLVKKSQLKLPEQIQVAREGGLEQSHFSHQSDVKILTKSFKSKLRYPNPKNEINMHKS